MGRYDRYDNYPGQGKRRGSKAMFILDLAVFIFTICVGVLLLSAYLARWIHPEKAWFFAFAGLVAPILYVLNIIAVLYWIVRWKWFVLIPVVILALGFNNISLFFRPALSKHYKDIPRHAVTVMSFNAMGFITPVGEGRWGSSLDSVTAFIDRYDPAVLCLQEYQSKDAGQQGQIDSMIKLRYNKVYYKKANSNGGGWGIAVYSRFPIVNSGYIDYPESGNSSMWVDIVARPDTIRIFNNHLQTTSVNAEEQRYISNQEFMQDASGREQRVRGIASKLKRNFVKRAVQVDSLAPIIEESPYPVFVCGDFNDTPMSYAYFKIRGGLKDTFVEKGHGMTSNTFKGLFNIFRIDYILHSPQIRALSYDTPATEFSDHKAVVGVYLLPAAP